MRKLVSRPKLPRHTRGLTKFRKTEISRAAKGLHDAGFSVRGVEVDPHSGKFVVLVGEPGKEPGNDLDKWLGKKDASAA